MRHKQKHLSKLNHDIDKKQVNKKKKEIKERKKDLAPDHEQKIIANSHPKYASDKSEIDTHKQYLKELEKMQEDIDILNEYMEVLAIAKDRVKRAVEEESDTKMVLSTTGNAIKDYAKALKDFQEMTTGVDSVAKLRYSQMAKMVSDVLCNTNVSDKTRMELAGIFESPLVVPSEPETPVDPNDDLEEIPEDD